MSLLYLDTLTLYGSASAMSAAGLAASGTSVAFDASGGVEGRPCMVVTGSGQVVVPTDGSYKAGFSAVNHAQIYVGFRMKVVTPPAASSTTVISVWQAGSRVIDIDLTPILGIKAMDNLGSPYSGGQRVQAFKQGAWHSVSIECAMGSLTGSIRGYVDGVSVLAAHNLDTDVSGGNFVKIQIGDSGNPAVLGHELHIDNLVIHDADGSDYSASQRWHGMAAQLPDATDSVPNVVVGAASAHLAVDDAAGTDSDGDTSYVEPRGEIEPATLSFPALPAGSVKTPQVVMGLCEVKVGTGAASVPKIRIELDDEREDFPLDLAVGYEVWRGHTFDQPGTTDAWTKAAAESTRIEVAADFSWPSSVVAVHRESDATFAAGGANAIPNLISPGTYDMAQATVGERPDAVSGPPTALRFDRSNTDNMEALPATDWLPAGGFVTMWCICEPLDVSATHIYLSTGSFYFVLYASAGNIYAFANTAEGNINAVKSFSVDGAYHLLEFDHTASGIRVGVDGDFAHSPSPNTGSDDARSGIRLGTHDGSSDPGDMNFILGAVGVGMSESDKSDTREYLATLVP